MILMNTRLAQIVNIPKQFRNAILQPATKWKFLYADKSDSMSETVNGNKN